MPDIAHVRQLFSYFFSLLSYQSFLILTFFSSSFFLHHPEWKLNLICAETPPAGRSCLWDDTCWVEKYRPPHLPQVPCLFSPPPQLSFAFHAGSLGDITPWTAPLRRIYWLHKNRGYLTRVITVCGPAVRKHRVFIIILGGSDISHRNETSWSPRVHRQNRMAWAEGSRGWRLGLKWLVSDVAKHSDTQHVNESCGEGLPA